MRTLKNISLWPDLHKVLDQNIPWIMVMMYQNLEKHFTMLNSRLAKSSACLFFYFQRTSNNFLSVEKQALEQMSVGFLWGKDNLEELRRSLGQMRSNDGPSSMGYRRSEIPRMWYPAVFCDAFRITFYLDLVRRVPLGLTKRSYITYYYYQGWIFFRGIFQGWIFFRSEYFSGVNLFQGWIFFGGEYF